MASPNLLINCPHCSGQFDLIQGWEDEDARKFVELITQLQPSAVRPCFKYLTICFKPKAQALRWSTLLKLAKELVPMIKEAQIKRNGTRYTVPLPVWITAMTSLATAAPTNLQMPLKNHAYLLTILANQAEQVAAKADVKVEQQRQVGARPVAVEAEKTLSFAELTALAAQKEQELQHAEPARERTVTAIPQGIKDALGMGVKPPLSEAEIEQRRIAMIETATLLLAEDSGIVPVNDLLKKIENNQPEEI